MSSMISDPAGSTTTARSSMRFFGRYSATTADSHACSGDLAFPERLRRELVAQPLPQKGALEDLHVRRNESEDRRRADHDQLLPRPRERDVQAVWVQEKSGLGKHELGIGSRRRNDDEVPLAALEPLN